MIDILYWTIVPKMTLKRPRKCLCGLSIQVTTTFSFYTWYRRKKEKEIKQNIHFSAVIMQKTVPPSRSFTLRQNMKYMYPHLYSNNIIRTAHVLSCTRICFCTTSWRTTVRSRRWNHAKHARRQTSVPYGSHLYTEYNVLNSSTVLNVFRLPSPQDSIKSPRGHKNLLECQIHKKWLRIAMICCFSFIIISWNNKKISCIDI